MEFALMLLISFSDQLFVNYCTSLNQSDMVTRSNTATTIVKYITNGKIDELKLELIKKFLGVFALICGVVTGVYAVGFLVLTANVENFAGSNYGIVQVFLLWFKEPMMKFSKELMIKF
eukprot:505696_1